MNLKNIKLNRKTVFTAAAVLTAVILLIIVLGQCSGKDDVSSVPEQRVVDYSSKYTVVFDSSEFTSTKKNGVEKIKYIATPESYLTISHVDNCSFSEHIDNVVSEMSVGLIEKDIKLAGNENSLGIRYATGSFESDIITSLYAVDDGAGGCFEIRYINTIGTDNDLGAKFKQIAQSFKLTGL